MDALSEIWVDTTCWRVYASSDVFAETVYFFGYFFIWSSPGCRAFVSVAMDKPLWLIHPLLTTMLAIFTALCQSIS